MSDCGVIAPFSRGEDPGPESASTFPPLPSTPRQQRPSQCSRALIKVTLALQGPARVDEVIACGVEGRPGKRRRWGEGRGAQELMRIGEGWYGGHP